MVDKHLIVVTPDCTIHALIKELSQNQYSSAVTCRFAHASICKKYGIKCYTLQEVLPVRERNAAMLPILHRISDLILKGDGNVLPYPDYYPYKINSISLINFHSNRRIASMLFWKVYISKLIQELGTYEWKIIGTNPVVDDICEIVKEHHIKVTAAPVAINNESFQIRSQSTKLKLILNSLIMLPRLLVSRGNTLDKILIFDQRTFRPIIESYSKGEASLVLGPSSITNDYLAKQSWRLDSEVLLTSGFNSKVTELDRDAAKIVVNKVRSIYRSEGDREESKVIANFWKTAWNYNSIIDENALKLAFISRLWRRLDRLRPKVCISSGLFDPATVARLGWFKHYGLPMINMDVGIELGGNPAGNAKNSQYDYFFAPGDEFAKRKKNADKGNTKYIVVGNPIYNNWLKRKGSKSGNKVLIAPSSMANDFYTDAEDGFWTMMKSLVLNNSNIDFIVRPHALERDSDVNSHLINEIINLPNCKLNTESDNYKSLINSKLVITTWSTIALDSMVLKRPVIILNLALRNIGYNDYIPDQVVNEDSKLKEVFNNLINNDSERLSALNKQKVFCDLFAGLHIENVAEHVKKQILNVVDGTV